MSEVNPLFRAHMLLLAWGRRALTESAANGGQLPGRPPSAADDGSGGPVDEIAASDPAYGDQCPRNRAG
jgi:hypothetical protein